MASTLTSMPGVPSYFPAYKRWLTIRERARFGRLLAPQNLLLSRFEGEYQLTHVHSANAQMRRWETRLSSFYVVLLLKILQSIKRSLSLTT